MRDRAILKSNKGNRENFALHFALLTSNLTLRTGNEVDSRENTTILNL